MIFERMIDRYTGLRIGCVSYRNGRSVREVSPSSNIKLIAKYLLILAILPQQLMGSFYPSVLTVVD